MGEIVKEKDFVEVEYTGRLIDNTIFDTTDETVAKENGLFSKNAKYAPAVVCVGQKQILHGFDDELAGKEVGKEYEIKLSSEKAFGKRDIKKMKIIPMSTFREHKIEPRPGLQVDVDGQTGVVTRVSGGRVMVNFNHPLAGKEVIYKFKINKIVKDEKEKVASFLSGILKMPEERIKVKIEEEKAVISLPMEIPVQITNILMEKLVELTNLKDFVFENHKKSETENEKGKEVKEEGKEETKA